MRIKSVKTKISKKNKLCVFSHVIRITQPKKVPRSKDVTCSPRTGTHTNTQTRVTTEAPFQGFGIFFFNLSSRIGPIITKLYYETSSCLRLKRGRFLTRDHMGSPLKIQNFEKRFSAC